VARSSKSAEQKTASVVRMRPPRKSPMCGKPATQQYYPFDSKRCADADLANWLGGSYRIAGDPVSPTELPTDDE